MAARLQVRRGKASRWKELNPVLAWGEIAHEIDTNFLKIGDGVSDWNSLPYFEGKQGLQGIRGEKGEKGDQGDIGPRGLQGLQGIQGIQGERGQKGDTGEKGEKGDRGPQGLKGEKGDKGQKGDKGERGEKGDRGERGLPGPQGVKGETGEQGPIGPAGPQGEQGSDGIASVSYPLKYKDKHLSVEQAFFTELVDNASKGFSAQGSGGGNLAIRWNGEKVVSAARNLNFTGTAISNVVVDGKDVTLTINDTGGGGGGSQNVFSTFAVAGQSNIVADTTTDTFTFFAGSNIVLTTNPTTDTLSIALADEITVLDVNTDRIDFNLTPAATTVPQGRMIWDTSLSTVVLGMDNNVAAAIGQALYKFVHNSSGSPINKGQVVYISGGHASTSLTIELADASSEATAATTIGVAAEDIPHGSDGFIVTQGLLTGIRTNNTPGTGGEGDIIWLDSVAGGFTFDRPTQPDHGVMVGWVVKLAGAGAGSIFVKITNGQELYELHDVLIQSLVDKHLLQYDGVAGVWKNKSVSEVINALTNVDLTTNNQLRFTYANNTTETFNFGSLAFLNGSLGSNGQVLFNNAGSIAGDAGLTYDPATDTLTSGVLSTNQITFTTNGEFITNSTNGRIDFNPAPTGSGAYGFYMDMTSSGNSVRIGNFRSSDGALNLVPFAFMTDIDIAPGYAIGMANQAFRLWYSQKNNPTGTLGRTLFTAVTNNADHTGAFIFAQIGAQNSLNRSPASQVNPTVYVYSNDLTEANDFVRMTHNQTDGLVESGNGKLLLKAASNVRIQGSAGAFDLPAGDGTLNQVIATNGSGVSSWTTLGSLAFQSGTFSGSSSGTNTGDQNVFTTIAVAGQSNVVADSTSDTLTFVAGSGISLTTDATNDTITITNTGGGGGGGGVTEEFVIAMAIAL